MLGNILDLFVHLLKSDEPRRPDWSSRADDSFSKLGETIEWEKEKFDRHRQEWMYKGSGHPHEEVINALQRQLSFADIARQFASSGDIENCLYWLKKIGEDTVDRHFEFSLGMIIRIQKAQQEQRRREQKSHTINNYTQNINEGGRGVMANNVTGENPQIGYITNNQTDS